MHRPVSRTQQAAWRLCFASLSGRGEAYSFACDARGQVDMDAMSERERSCYLYARALVGLQFRPATVEGRHQQEEMT